MKIPSVLRVGAAALVGFMAWFVPARFAGAQDATAGAPNATSALKWRLIGPFRGGRVLAVTGIADQPNVYYFGSVGGGAWKTTDGGEVWKPIFDGEPVASIGAIAVAPSDPNIIYVGTGEADMRSDIGSGDGVYKSNDAGEKWKNIGLRDTQQIGRILVDPQEANTVLVAALGHGYGANSERGVFRSTDGGATWQRVLHTDDDTGAVDLCYDPVDSKIVYAAMWNVRRPPWTTYAPIGGPGGGLFKSIDGGATWSHITGGGLPAGDYGRIGIAAARTQGGTRVFALIDAKDGGLFRSDDGGANWQKLSDDARVRGRAWYFMGITVDPSDVDKIYIANTAFYRSNDGGRTFEPFKGAPGGDDYHSLWIAPNDSRRMILGSDQGAAISVDRGATWSSWFNQPTGQFYHVTTDNQFPYFVYGPQQDSGTAAVPSRSDYGGITFRDWAPAGGDESGYLIPDPDDRDVVYGGGPGGSMTRFHKSTGQSQIISPKPVSIFGDAARFPWTAPIAISPRPPHVLYTASQCVYRSTDGGQSWQTISPDLTHNAATEAPSAAGARIELSTHNRGVVYALAPSPLDGNLIWAGTDTGLIHVTNDAGKAWKNVTPADWPAWSRISVIEASRYDAGTAYVAIDRHRMDDFHPYIFKTKDFGKTWEKITTGIGERDFAWAVREDTVRRGLLFAGTEFGIYYSADDGAHWESLQLNLPVVSVRDIAVHGDDVTVATHGRAFWILDDIAPLREMDAAIAAENAHLFKPATAIRIRASENHDTPLPAEIPAGTNPRTGAVVDYYLKDAPSEDVTLAVYDASGKLVREFSSTAAAETVPKDLRVAPDWLLPEPRLTKNRGVNRFVWDLRYERAQALHYDYAISAVHGQNVQSLPEGPMVVPGDYELRLTVGGKSYKQTLHVKLDPRVKATRTEFAAQVALELKIRDALKSATSALAQIRDAREKLKKLQVTASGHPDIQTMLTTFDQKTSALIGDEGDWPLPSRGLTGDALNLASLSAAVDTADAAPTASENAAWKALSSDLQKELSAWSELQRNDLAALNEQLRVAGMAEITVNMPVTPR